MNRAKALKEAVKFELQHYKRPTTFESLRENHVSFSGSPRKHPYDNEKVVLVNDPFSSNHFYYEFKRDDIVYVEELSNIVNLDNETIAVVRIWVAKNSIAVRSTPFIVGDTINNR